MTRRPTRPLPPDRPAAGRRPWALRTGVAAVAAVIALGALGPVRAADDPAAAPHASGPVGGLGTELVLRALGLLGVNYRWGGNTPDDGLDCSGLVRHVFRETVGLVLPRRSEEMGRSGQSIANHQLRPGDLVFFNTLQRTFSHVGIYIGNNQFVHAPSSGGVVRVDSLEARYWTDRFDGARRVLPADEELPFVSGALDRLLSAMSPEPTALDGILKTSSASAARTAPPAAPRATAHSAHRRSVAPRRRR